MDQILARFPHLTPQGLNILLKTRAAGYSDLRKVNFKEALAYVTDVITKHSDADYRQKFVTTFFHLKENHLQGIAVNGSALWPIYKEMSYQESLFHFFVMANGNARRTKKQ